MTTMATLAGARSGDAEAAELTGVRHGKVTANGIKQHYVEAGSGPAVVLLHGFPETCFAWRKQIPILAERYRVIAPDLRGYGDTEKPEGGYDKRTMARDLAALLDSLGVERAAILGHDRGARVATRFAKDFPTRISHLGVFENIPTRIIFEQMDAKRAKVLWFFLFNQLPDGLPEAFFEGRQDMFLRYLFSHWCYNPDVLDESEIATYVRAYSQSGAVQGFCNDYKAAAEDVAQDDVDANVKIACPTLALWGAQSTNVADLFDVVAVWRAMASNLTTHVIQKCGHLPHEEQPDEFNKAVMQFLRSA